METLEDEGFIYNFKEGRIFRKWKHIIKETGLSLNKGHYQIFIDGKNFFVHRILYEKYHNTIIPEGLMIDHIDRNKSNNCINNLRLVTNTQNQQNTSKRITNTSGHKNIYWNTRAKRWRVSISVNCKNIHHGYFENLEDAIIKRDAVILELNSQGHIFTT